MFKKVALKFLTCNFFYCLSEEATEVTHVIQSSLRLV